jgi:hypothetical protein
MADPGGGRAFLRTTAARLTLLNEDRQLAAGMVENLWQRCDTRDWSDVGADFLKLAALALQAKASAGNASHSKSL